MSTSDVQPPRIAFFDYALPNELIAQTPAEPRDSARLLVVQRETGQLSDRVFRDLPELLRPGDALVVNDTRVLPGRLHALRATGGRVEILLLERVSGDVWRCIARPAGRLRLGESLTLVDATGAPSIEQVEVAGRDGETLLVRVSDATIAARGTLPLPPYITTPLVDPERYQTVFSREAGSAAAPTAGLHFTEELLRRCADAGISRVTITLHVGLDTFKPIRVDDVRQHTMHSEAYSVRGDALRTLRETRAAGGRVIAVGTTSVRTLESIADHLEAGIQHDVAGSTRLYITPGYQFRVVDVMITNFHLPRTTLLLLVGAFAGGELIRRAYEHAIDRRYRFYSFGDAMLIV